MSKRSLVETITRLKEKKNAVILAHNYQRPEIYQVADFIGDSYELSRKAADTEADIIVFCGVDFMAETSYILNPEKMVLMPTILARCPMAAMISIRDLGKLKEKHPDAAVVSYVNTTAEIKAESDICCTSANAMKVISSLSEKEVIFVPDVNLASYVARRTDKTIIPWDGWCYVHTKFTAEGLKEAKKLHPAAEVIVHPECIPQVTELADQVCSTSAMIAHVKRSRNKEFIVATEAGIMERLRLEASEKTCYQAPPGSVCAQMKENTLRLVLETLEREQNKVVIRKETMIKAKEALDGMLNVA